MQTAVIWKDKKISIQNILVIIITIIGLLTFPLIFLLFKDNAATRLTILLYILDIPLALFITLFLSYEKNRKILISQSGISIRWKPQTKNILDIIRWEEIKRINLISAWSKKSYSRWGRMHKKISHQLMFLSVINPTILIIEDKKDKIHLIGIIDIKGFEQALNIIAQVQPLVNEIPMMDYGVLVPNNNNKKKQQPFY